GEGGGGGGGGMGRLGGGRHGLLPSGLLERSWRRVHPKGLRSSKGDVRVEGEWLSVDKPQARKPAGQSLQGNLRPELSPGGAQAVVEPFSKREGLRCGRPLPIGRLRPPGEGGGAPRCREPEKELRPLR